MRLMHCLGFWSAGLLVACTSTEPAAGPAPDQQVEVLHRYAPVSSLGERASLSEASKPPENPAPRVEAPTPPRPLSKAELDELSKRALDGLSQDRVEEAALLFEEAQRLSAIDERGLMGAALAHLEMGNIPKAATYAQSLWRILDRRRSRTLEEDLRSSPYREAALVLSSVQIRTHEVASGVALLEKLVNSASDWPAGYIALASHYLDKAAPHLAATVARTGLDRTREQEPALFVLLSRAERTLGRKDEALRVLARGQALFPADAGISLWLGVLEYDAGFLTSACERFALAYERGRHLSDAAHNHALCLVRQGEWDHATSVLKLAIVKNPDVPALRLLYGQVAKFKGDLAVARQAWLDFLQLAPLSDPDRVLVEAALADLSVVHRAGNVSERHLKP